MLMAQTCSGDSPARRASTFVLQEPLDFEGWSWPIGMGRWTEPALATHHPLVKPNALGLKFIATL